MNTIDKMRRDIMAMFAPPPNISVAEWAEQSRFLSSETSASTGRWKNSKAPYQKEIMDAFTQKRVERLVLEFSAQTGKSEIIMNMMGRTIDLDPCPMMMVQPTQDTAEEFSKRRVSSMISACPTLRRKVSAAKSRSSSNTIRFKSFPGGSLSIASAQSAPELRSKPVRFLFMDETDAYPPSAGGEGDPVELAIARTETFHNRKIVMVSTPGEEKTSTIHSAYLDGTQEEWCLPCPHCEEYSFLRFQDFLCDYEEYEAGGKKQFIIKSVRWKCPNCGDEFKESEMSKQPGKWIARNERALEKGVRSFHMNGFASPWTSWRKIMGYWLTAKGDPEKEQAFTNVRLGEPWTRKSESSTTAEEIYKRREDYVAEVPDRVLVLTMGVDTQDNRLEYEVVGWGRNDESWGIAHGIIPGRPDDASRRVWKELDAILDRNWKRADGQAMRVLVTFVDSGGHCTDAVYEECKKRERRHVFAIKGEPGDGKQFVRVSETTKKKRGIFLFLVGVDAGKEAIHFSLNTKKPGEWYSHFPSAPEAGYDRRYFDGLFAEKLEVRSRGGRQKMVWVKDPTIQARNEPLDLRNYARAAFKAFQIDLDTIEDKLTGKKKIITPAQQAAKKKSSVKVLDSGIKV